MGMKMMTIQYVPNTFLNIPKTLYVFKQVSFATGFTPTLVSKIHFPASTLRITPAPKTSHCAFMFSSFDAISVFIESKALILFLYLKIKILKTDLFISSTKNNQINNAFHIFLAESCRIFLPSFRNKSTVADKLNRSTLMHVEPCHKAP